MKKVSGFRLLLLLGIIGLSFTACEEETTPTATATALTAAVATPTSAPTIAPTEALAADRVTEGAALAGVWQGDLAGELGHLLFTEDGQFHVSLIADNLRTNPNVRGDYWFADNLLHLQDQANRGHWAECEAVGIYEVHRREDGRIWFVPVDEACSQGGFTRQYVFSNMVMTRLGPS
jgi:hypothetical protein